MSRVPRGRQTRTIRGQEAVPLDAVADRVTRPGPDYGPSLRGRAETREFDVRPPTFPVPRGFGAIRDLSGVRRGRLTVEGWLREPKNSKGQAWLVRCDCGRYERRRFKSTVTRNDQDMCGVCAYNEALKKRAARGPWIPNQPEWPACMTCMKKFPDLSKHRCVSKNPTSEAV